MPTASRSRRAVWKVPHPRLSRSAWRRAAHAGRCSLAITPFTLRRRGGRHRGGVPESCCHCRCSVTHSTGVSLNVARTCTGPLNSRAVRHAGCASSLRRQSGPGRGVGAPAGALAGKVVRPVTNRTTQMEFLACLGAYLASHGFAVDLTRRGLKVINSALPGCCDQVRHPCDTITCRRRLDDGGRMWFFTSWREPIAEVHQIPDATIVIRRLLQVPAMAGDVR